VPIPFNRPTLAGMELDYIRDAIARGQLAGDGAYTERCQVWLRERIGAGAVLLTHSCTAALEMAALLLDIGPGDEVVMPSFTFVSTANAVVLRGGVPVFVDIRPDTLNIDEALVEAAVTPRTRAIMPVHYAGVPAEMDALDVVARRHGLSVIEDAAQALGSTYRGRNAGALGSLAAFSFHETKNIISGGGRVPCDQRSGPDRAGRDHPREGHEPEALLPRRGRQIHLGRHRLELSAVRDPGRLPVGADRGSRPDSRTPSGDLEPL
jgi:dTDP-4-amino-4,6-dideoxygalactose transaminase